MWNGWEGLSVLHHMPSGSASSQTTAQRESLRTDLADFYIIWLVWMKKEEEATINMTRGSSGSSGSAQKWKSTIQTQLNCLLMYHCSLSGGRFKYTFRSKPTRGWSRTSDFNTDMIIWPDYFRKLRISLLWFVFYGFYKHQKLPLSPSDWNNPDEHTGCIFIQKFNTEISKIEEDFDSLYCSLLKNDSKQKKTLLYLTGLKHWSVSLMWKSNIWATECVKS